MEPNIRYANPNPKCYETAGSLADQSVASDHMVQSLDVIISTLIDVANSQEALRERLFGPWPQPLKEKDNTVPAPTGVVGHIKDKLAQVYTLTERLSVNQRELSRVA